MSPQRWQRLGELYDVAVDLAATERAEFLDEQCQGDEELRHELTAMLRDAGSGFTKALEQGVADAADNPGGWVGRRMGPYRILRSVGSGGMGAVFLAVRDDDQFHKEVAIKTLKVETGDSFTLTRFRHERQILAGLEHPNIARLLDGGANQQGTPYLVMEYVDGTPLTEYCRQRQLSVEGRLRVFREVCAAVQHAHQNLIVHRDIKPGNILVTAEGVPKLLDFGIAKLLDPTQGTGELPVPTATMMRLMTPDYASPEQVRGEAVSTATDVYSLGAVLYELLTGTRAHAIKSYDAVEIARVVCQTEVTRPSARGDRRLRGDLDNIILKALQKDAARRYSSVEQFSEDIRRYLEGLPVAARADTFHYRTGKYVRRHRLGLAAAAAFTLVLGVGVASSLYEARIARARFQQLRKLANRFLFDFDAQIRTLPGSTKAREMLVSTALEYLDNLARDAQGDPGLQWELSEAYLRVGDVQGSYKMPSLGRTKAMIDSYRKALAMEEDLARRGLLDSAKRTSLANAYAELAGAYRATGEFKESILAAERGVAHARLISEDAISTALSNLGLAQSAAGEPLLALQSAGAALPTKIKSAREEVGWGPRHNTLAVIYGLKGRAAAGLLRLEESVAANQEAIAIREGRLADHVWDPVNARDLVINYHAAADVLGDRMRFNLGRSKEAEVYYRKALALAEQTAAADPNNATAKIEVARSAGKLGSVLDLSDPEEALRWYRKSESVVNELPPGAQHDALLEAVRESPIWALAALGRTKEVRERVNLAKWEAHVAQKPGDSESLNSLYKSWRALAYSARRDARVSVEHHTKSLSYADRAAALQPASVMRIKDQLDALESLAAGLERAGGARQAVELQRRVADLWVRIDAMYPGSVYVHGMLKQAKEGRFPWRAGAL